jgi:hypothetical protein
MRAVRMRREWDRKRVEFVEIPVQNPPDDELSCSECRYYDERTGRCNGVGSRYYLKRVPSRNFVPKLYDCEVRLAPDLFAFV